MRDVIKKFSVTVWAIIALILISALLAFEGTGIRYDYKQVEAETLPHSVIAKKKDIKDIPATCLLVNDSRQEYNEMTAQHLDEVLKIMKVPFKTVDLAKDELPDFSDYRTVVFSFHDLLALGERGIDLGEYVFSGGRVMFTEMPDFSTVFSYLSPFIGIKEGSDSYVGIHGVIVKEGFMLGAKGGFEFDWVEPMTISVAVGLDPEKATVWAESDDEQRVPLVWSTDYGEGRWVVMNHSLFERLSRGLTCAAYSLLEDYAIWPVINASTFYLDDFPSPVPMGDGIYVRRDYNRDIASFYASVWMPDVVSIMEDYGIPFTGMIIEDYSDDTHDFPRQTDVDRFDTFGAFLLKHGGELGLHGYNHQPFCLPGFDFQNKVDYNHWMNEEDIVRSLNEVLGFAKQLYPKSTIRTYVPPSNILSAEGRDILVRNMPDLMAICSTFTEGSIEYTQEFEVADDGIVEYPRIISGGVLDSYDRWAAICCLNIYYVNTHFMHPDDCLDEDRGAELGWETLYTRLRNYIEWLQEAAPNLRQLTASAGAAATARFDVVGVDRTETDKAIKIRLTGFWDECWLMIRCNGGYKPGNVTGGEVEHVAGDNWLLHATTDVVNIQKVKDN